MSYRTFKNTLLLVVLSSFLAGSVLAQGVGVPNAMPQAPAAEVNQHPQAIEHHHHKHHWKHHHKKHHRHHAHTDHKDSAPIK